MNIIISLELINVLVSVISVFVLKRYLDYFVKIEYSIDLINKKMEEYFPNVEYDDNAIVQEMSSIQDMNAVYNQSYNYVEQLINDDKVEGVEVITNEQEKGIERKLRGY